MLCSVLRIAYRRMSRSFEVNAPSLNTGWLNRLVVAIGTTRPVSSSAARNRLTRRSRSAASEPNGIRSSSWNDTPYAPSSASSCTATTGSSGGRTASPNGSTPCQPTVHSPKLNRSALVGTYTLPPPLVRSLRSLPYPSARWPCSPLYASARWPCSPLYASAGSLRSLPYPLVRSLRSLMGSPLPRLPGYSSRAPRVGRGGQRDQGGVVEHRLQGDVRSAAGRRGEAQPGQLHPAAPDVRCDDAGAQLGHRRSQQVRAEAGEIAAQHEHPGVEDVYQDRGAQAEPGAHLLQRVQGAAVACLGASPDHVQPPFQVQRRVAHRVVRAGRQPEQARQTHHRLPAAAPAAAAHVPARVQRDVADLAGEPLRAAQQPPARDHAAAHAGLAGEVDQVWGAGDAAHRVLPQRRQVGVVGDPDRERDRTAEPGSQPGGHAGPGRHLPPVQVG